MTRETRISLLVGLAFVVMFGLVLSELTGVDETPAPVSASDTAPDGSSQSGRFVHVYPIEIDAPRAAAPRQPARQRQTLRRPASQRPAPVAVQPQRRSAPVAEIRPISAPAGWRKYTVQPGDTLIDIARRHYGEGNENLYIKIMNANRSEVPDAESLRIGQVLRIPPGPGAAASSRAQTSATSAVQTANTALDMSARPSAPAAAITLPTTRAPAQPAPAPTARRTHVVTQTDTLPEIAWKYYHNDDRSAVMKIFDANRAKLYGLDHLPEGMVLVIPD